MIGIVIVTHAHLAEEFIRAGEMILGKLDQIVPVPVLERENVDIMRAHIQEAIKKVNSGDGVLILVDMFGGTPSNISMAFLEKGKVEVLTGLNLPMIMKLSPEMRNQPLAVLAAELKKIGQKYISLAGEVLEGSGR